MPFKRAERVADLIRRELTDILRREVGDRRIAGLTITGVKLTDDLRNARIFFVEMGKDTCDPETAETLRRASGFLKRELGSRLRLRYVPDIVFQLDESFAYGSRIERLIRDIRAAEEPHAEPDR